MLIDFNWYLELFFNVPNMQKKRKCQKFRKDNLLLFLNYFSNSKSLLAHKHTQIDENSNHRNDYFKFKKKKF